MHKILFYPFNLSKQLQLVNSRQPVNSVANYKKDDDTIVLDDNGYFWLLVESLDSGDTRTTEEEGAKNDEIQPEDDTPQVQLEEEGDQLETEKSDFVGNGHRHSVQTRKPVTTLLSMTTSAEKSNLVNLSVL